MNKFFFRPSIFTVSFLVFLSLSSMAQTFTMGKECKALALKGKEELNGKNFQQANQTFTTMKGSCKTRDAKEVVAVGLAESLNGLGRYDDAIKASNEALKLTKNKSLAAHFQKGFAQNKLKQYDASKASLQKVLELTEKNTNLKQRASNYALMAALYDRQLGNSDSAAYFLDKAIAMDSANPDFFIQKGDMLVEAKEFEGAFVAYDKAVVLGRTGLDMYIIRSDAGLKMMENKYHTTNAQDLRSKMSPEEKALVCADLKKALDLGWKNMNKDMFAALVCK